MVNVAMIGLFEILVHWVVFHGWLCGCEAGTWATERSLPSQQEATHRPPPPLTVTITDISNIANQTPRLFQYIPTHKLHTPAPASTLAVIRILNLQLNKYIPKGYCWGTSPFLLYFFFSNIKPKKYFAICYMLIEGGARKYSTFQPSSLILDII